MFLKPKNLKELEAGLKQLPPEKRKVIVLVGRHPNEGTHLIARQHHKQWEEHGAVAVKIPLKWTPPGFWFRTTSKRFSTFFPGKATKAAKNIPTDYELIKFLEERGLNVPFVNLHGWPQQYITSTRKEISDPYPSGLHFGITRYSRIPNAAVGKNKYPEDALIHPNELVVEFAFPGKEKKEKPLWFDRAKKIANKVRNKHPASLLHFVPNPQLSDDYLIHRKRTTESLKLFADRYANEFNQVLAELVKNGLKPE